jgi:hypothetical protein
MSDLDNRIRLDETPVDFDKSGTTGQLHDEYPAARSQARYDQMRTFLMGLLANQSCDESIVTGSEPYEKRVGTLWYKKHAKLFSLFANKTEGDAWDDALAKYIGVQTGEEVESIQSAIDSIRAMLAYAAPRLIWCGYFVSDSARSIPVPDEYQAYLSDEHMLPMLYIAGKFIDPRLVIKSGTYIIINESVKFLSRQDYTVILEHVTSLKNESIPVR